MLNAHIRTANDLKIARMTLDNLISTRTRYARKGVDLNAAFIAEYKRAIADYMVKQNSIKEARHGK
jgi:hypothetical protein